jgi:hypothetical protein
MRATTVVLVGVFFATSQAHAALNAVYKGTAEVDGKKIPAVASMSLADDRAAFTMQADENFRILFLQKENLLRVVNDSDQTYIDMQGGMANFMSQEMEKELAQMPPEQRRMAEQMMQNMGSAVAASTPPTRYVWTEETGTVKGYPCTWVRIMEGDKKKADYCGTSAADFKISDAELKSATGLNKALDMTPAMKGGSAQSRDEALGFAWDTSKDGYPIIARCFNGDRMVLDLELDSFNRQPPPAKLFEIPEGYKKR